MPVANISPGAWTALVTTAADTVIQNQSQREVYITTEATGGLGAKDGTWLKPYEEVVISTGKNVAIYAHLGTARIHYMDA
jgi:hypothetical protein